MNIEDVARRRARYRNSYYSATAEEMDLVLAKVDELMTENKRLQGEMTMIARWMGDSNHIKRFARWLRKQQNGADNG